MTNTSRTSIEHEGAECHQQHAETAQEPVETVTVICPRHGEHQYAIVSNIDSHEGAWCQLCWLDSLGPSLPYRTTSRQDDETAS